MNEGTVHRAVAGAEIVINMVGALTESQAASFQAVHTEGSERIARLAAANGVRRLIQVSAIGADSNSPSRYGSTKGNAEQAVLGAFPAATVLRPSLVFGIEDKFFNRFAEIARIAPFMPVIAGATKMQPVFVGDIADAVMAALASDTTMGKTFELGGPRVWTFREILAFILRETRRHKRLVDIPMGIARLQASIMQHMPGKPLTPDQLLMLEKDNIVSEGALGLADLGITPTPVELVVPAYLSRYQPGGGRRPPVPLTA
jgi:NADH dehydrogenase